MHWLKAQVLESDYLDSGPGSGIYCVNFNATEVLSLFFIIKMEVIIIYASKDGDKD